jgi:transcriptional regulator with XRE-family HTH domain
MARTPKARALGAALRKAREDKGMILRQLGAAVDRDIGVLSRWENGERIPKPEQVAQILTALSVNGQRYEEIMTLAYGTAESQWVATTLPEQRQQMAAYLDWEQNATGIVEVAPLLIPGILQTGDYVRAIMTAPGVAITEKATRVSSRLGRREVITRKRNPAKLLVLLGRAALKQSIGGRQVLIDQLQDLLEMAARPNVELRVIPDYCDWHPGLEGAFALIEAKRAPGATASIALEGAFALIEAKRAPGATASIAFVETRRSVLMLHEKTDVDAYRWSIDRIMEKALKPDVSLKLIADLHNRMERDRGT